MKWIDFHHPDISWPVIRRRASIEFMELVQLTALGLTRGGWAVVNRSCYPNRAAYRNAASRLQKGGLIVRQTATAQTPELILTDEGRRMLPDYFTPEKYWKRRWNGIWYLLMYDVPEIDKKYRNVLRQFLKRMRMGCLQKSVWISPRDIRPEFEDLATAAGLDGFAYLFETKTVLSFSSWRIIEDAWNIDRLRDLQEHYCDVAEENIAQLEAGESSCEELALLARMAVAAYHAAFIEDPLLPKPLLPESYLGREVLRRHNRLFELIDEQLGLLSSG